MISLTILLFIALLAFLFSSNDWDKRELFIISSLTIAFSAFMIFGYFKMSSNYFDFNKIADRSLIKSKELFIVATKKDTVYANNRQNLILEITKNISENKKLLGYTIILSEILFDKNHKNIVKSIKQEKRFFIKANPNKFKNLKDLREYTLNFSNKIVEKLNLSTKPIKNQGNPYYLLFILFFCYGIYFISKSAKIPDIKIVANQQRYYDEVNRNMVYNFYENRKVMKNDRVEVLVNKHSKKLIKTFYNKIDDKEKISDSFISTTFFLNLKNINPTKIEKLDEIKSPIYIAIFKKIKSYVSSREEKLDYEIELKNNGYFLEFFLMDLWERYTGDINISVANLQVLATSDIEKELLGAIDNISLNSIKANGASLYYKYMYFKDRIKEYL